MVLAASPGRPAPRIRLIHGSEQAKLLSMRAAESSVLTQIYPLIREIHPLKKAAYSRRVEESEG
jgi:hypothetical protein